MAKQVQTTLKRLIHYDVVDNTNNSLIYLK
jgi:hypothetical protein